jgi:hypothetical protein
VELPAPEGFPVTVRHEAGDLMERVAFGHQHAGSWALVMRPFPPQVILGDHGWWVTRVIESTPRKHVRVDRRVGGLSNRRGHVRGLGLGNLLQTQNTGAASGARMSKDTPCAETPTRRPDHYLVGRVSSLISPSAPTAAPLTRGFPSRSRRCSSPRGWPVRSAVRPRHAAAQA